MFDRTTSIFAGMDDATLRTALANAQAAYIALVSGSKGESFSYAQGDGSKSVTYTKASMADLMMLIKELQAQLGIVRHPRRAIRPVF